RTRGTAAENAHAVAIAGCPRVLLPAAAAAGRPSSGQSDLPQTIVRTARSEAPELALARPVKLPQVEAPRQVSAVSPRAVRAVAALQPESVQPCLTQAY